MPFTAKYTILSHAVANCLRCGICIKGYNLVCYELAMLKMFDDMSETLLNVLDKHCITFGAR